MTNKIIASLKLMNDHCIDFLDSSIISQYEYALLGPSLNTTDNRQDIYEFKILEYFNFDGDFKYVWEKGNEKIVDELSTNSFNDLMAYYDENFVTYSYLIGDEFIIYNNNRDSISIIFCKKSMAFSTKKTLEYELYLIDNYFLIWHHQIGVGLGTDGDIYLKKLLNKLRKNDLVDENRFINFLAYS